MPLAVEIAVAKTNKYASRESGDTAELIERPGGGFSVVAVDGQGSGSGAKSLSLLLTSKAVALLKEGVRDGAVARAVHDVLFAFRQGRVSASLDILSIDLKTKSVVATRNGGTPMFVRSRNRWLTIEPSAGPIGRYHFTRPGVSHFQAESGLVVSTITDGVANAGDMIGPVGFDVRSFAEESLGDACDASLMAESILYEAIRRDEKRPRDDMTVVVLSLRGHDHQPLVRTARLYAPLA
ncbi:MAG: SpoIIE family protein phosphatase [Thermomicrobiales bacterium]